MALFITETTTAATNVTSTTALVGGEVTALNGHTDAVRGVCWIVSPGVPVLGTKVPGPGSGLGVYTQTLTGLPALTTINFAAYTTDTGSNITVGSTLSFTTIGAVPILTTLPVFTFTKTTATFRANATGDQGYAITERGVYWGTTADPVGAGTKVVGSGTGKGYFEVPVTGLPAGTIIYVAAYAINSQGTGYGAVLHFTTVAAGIPTINTIEPVSNIFTTVISGGNSVNDNGATLSETGIAWNTAPTPTIGDNTVVNSGDNYQPFSLTFASDPSTIYYVRAYATNAAGTGYGNEFKVQSEGIDMRVQHIEKVPITKVVPFSVDVPFDNSLTIAQTQVLSPTVFIPNTKGALAGNKALYRVVGDGATTPTFDPSFNAMSTTATYDTTTNKVNLIEFLFDGIDYWYNIINGSAPA